MRNTRLHVVAAALALAATPLLAQAPAAPPPGSGTQDLAKKLSNPVASLISVPFQANWEYGVGPEEKTRFFLNFQPVMPFSLNEDWNLIARVIVPVLSQPPLVAGGEATFGVSDLTASFFFSPARSKIVWGVGPALLLPTTADPFLGTEKWAAGPTVVVLKQAGPWTVGALANHLWSYGGADDRPDVNQTFLQPFLAYATKTGYTFTLNSEATGNWEAADGEEWTVPSTSPCRRSPGSAGDRSAWASAPATLSRSPKRAPPGRCAPS